MTETVVVSFMFAAGCASSGELPPELDPEVGGQLSVYAPVGGGVISDVTAERASQQISRGDLVVAVAEGDSVVQTGTWGVSVTGRGGIAINTRYGIAYAPYGGTARGGANSVAFARAGHALSGDGGVSIEKNGGYAECGSFGVARSDTPRPKITGRVRGGIGSVLVIVGRKDVSGSLETVTRIAAVGTDVDGMRIEPNVWYALDDNLMFVKTQGP